MLTVHHVVADSRSLALFNRDLAADYWSSTLGDVLPPAARLRPDVEQPASSRFGGACVPLRIPAPLR